MKKTTQRRAYVLYFSPNTIWVIKIEKNEMGRAYSKNGVDEKCIQEFSGETRGKETIEMTHA